MRYWQLFAVFAVLAATVAQLPAQTTVPVRKAVETITAADVARHIGVIAADSMMGRDTPSPGLELVARYVADQFKRFGLKPCGKRLRPSDYFAEHPVVPIEQIVANLNLDGIGLKKWKDTVIAIGKEYSDLGATLLRVNAAHPELHVAAIDDLWPEEQFFFRSDHLNFARKGVPILYLMEGLSPDVHQVTDSPDKIDAEKITRILRLVFHLAREVGNADQRPKWEVNYKQIVQQR
jgi:hypothetical protein